MYGCRLAAAPGSIARQTGAAGSRSREATRLEYRVVPRARHDIGPVGGHKTSANPHLVAHAGNCLPCSIDQGNHAITDRDAPAWRPSDVDVDESVAGTDPSADCHAKYQAVCRGLDLECADQLSL